MDYTKAYLKLREYQPEAIREEAYKGGLGGRRRNENTEPLDVPDREDISRKYFNMVKSIRREPPKEEEIQEYLEPESMSDSKRAPKTSTKPRGRGEIPKGEVPDYIFKGLVERGIPEHIAQGMLMNIKDESGFKSSIEEYEPNVHGTKGKGLYQLTGDRREAFEAQYGDDYSIDNQLDWLMYEWGNTEKSAFDKIKNTANAGEAGAAIVTHFLRPAAKHRKSRVQKYINTTPYLPSKET